MFVQARTVTSARKHDMRLRHGFDAIGAPRPSKTRCVNIATPYLILIKNVDDTTVVRAAILSRDNPETGDIPVLIRTS